MRVLSGVLETDHGFHILKLQGRQNALNLGLDQVKAQLSSRIAYERRTQRSEQLLEELKKKAGSPLDPSTADRPISVTCVWLAL